MITAWVTKYALTKGILEVKGYISEVNPDMFVYGDGLAFKNEWFLTKTEAIERADEMCRMRINSLRTSLAKMANLKIKITKVK